MAETLVGIFTVVHQAQDELDAFGFAVDSLRSDVRQALPELMRPHRVVYTTDIEPTAAVRRPEGRYLSNERIQVRPMRRSGGRLRRNRVAGTTIHEMGHGFRLSQDQREDFIDLFDAAGGWREGPYWQKVNEAFCYWLTRIATNSRLVSRYEDETRDLDHNQHDRFLEILLKQPVFGRDEAEENDGEPEDDPELLALQNWQNRVRAVVNNP